MNCPILLNGLDVVVAYLDCECYREYINLGLQRCIAMLEEEMIRVRYIYSMLHGHGDKSFSTQGMRPTDVVIFGSNVPIYLGFTIGFYYHTSHKFAEGMAEEKTGA